MHVTRVSSTIVEIRAAGVKFASLQVHFFKCKYISEWYRLSLSDMKLQRVRSIFGLDGQEKLIWFHKALKRIQEYVQNKVEAEIEKRK